VRISPSILSADFANLEREIGRVAAADSIHVDVMDGHFVPNLTIGLPVVRRLAAVSSLPLEVHLMIEDPDRWAPQYAEAGVATVTVHVEACRAPVRLLRVLRASGVKAGVAISPGTPLGKVIGLLGEVDQLLIMTVEPGFGGQPLIAATLDKVGDARTLIDTTGWEFEIAVDGGMDPTTAGSAADAGAGVIVAGSAVFGAPDPAAAIAALRAAAS
jgi:ribulose-phosphate 3-epimerase